MRGRRGRTVFISYRRGDSAGHTGRLRDRLVLVLGEERVFRDHDSIEPGRDFRDELAEALDETDVLLAVIGPRWLDATDAEGRRRIDDPADLLRVEIATALARSDVRVVPVLVEGARLPPTSALPTDLRPLVGRQSVPLRDDRWDDDVDRLTAAVLGPARPWFRRRTPVVAGVVVLPLIAIGFLLTRPDTGAEGDLRINFQSANAEVPDGYLIDAGDPFGPRTGPDQGDGLSYGWVRPGTDEPVSMIRHARDRGRSPGVEQRLDTLLHFRNLDPATGELDEASWELAVARGRYRVTATVGDEEIDSVHTLLAEGVPVVTGFQGSPSQQYETNTVDVEVTDGRLTLERGPDANTKITDVEVLTLP